MESLILSVQELTPKTADIAFHNTAAFLSRMQAGSGTSIGIHFNELTFVDPYGLACIWLICRQARTQTSSCTLSIPNFNVQSYLHRMGFFRLLDAAGIQLAHRGHLEAPFQRDSVLLLESTRLSPSLGSAQVEPIVGQVARILHTQLQLKPADIANVCTTLSEACLNVVDHSESEGLAAAQSYKKKDGTRYVLISVVDDGRGIRASLAERYSDAPSWDHKTAIVRSLQKHYSRFPDRGLGLYQINQIITKYSGSLHIRSGNTRLYIRQRGFAYPGAFFPGTQICISLSTP